MTDFLIGSVYSRKLNRLQKLLKHSLVKQLDFKENENKKQKKVAFKLQVKLSKGEKLG